MIEARTARLCPAVFCHFQQSKPVPKSKLAAVAEKLNPPLRRHSNFKFKCFCMNVNKLEGRLKPFIAPSETRTLRTDDLKSNQAGLGLFTFHHAAIFWLKNALAAFFALHLHFQEQHPPHKRNVRTP